MNPITWADLAAWQTVTGGTLTELDRHCLDVFDGAFLAEVADRLRPEYRSARSPE